MPEKTNNQSDSKQRFNFRISEETMDLVKQWYKEDNCTTCNEFMEKAILFYCGYIANSRIPNYIPTTLVTVLTSMMNDSDNRQNKQLFRLAVELSMIKNILATNEGIKKVNLDRLEGQCIAEVKRVNGVMKMEEAIKWQNS